MIRVLHMLGALNGGGAQSMIMNIYRRIDRSQIQFDFALDRPEEDFYREEVLDLGGRLYTVPRFRGINVSEIRRSWDRLFTRHPEYGIFHSHVRSYASIYMPVASSHGVTTVIHSHSTSNGKGITVPAKNLLQYPLRHQCDVLMACSDTCGRWLYGDKKWETGRSVVIPNGIDVGSFVFDEETRNACRRELGLSGNYVIGHLGRFSQAKNHTFLLDAFHIYSQRDPNARLLLVGDGELRREVEEKIDRLGLRDKVILTGNRSDIPGLLMAMDVMMFPSTWEGLPMSVLEAQSASLPCVISDVIPHDVDLSPLVMRLPIGDPTVWAEEMGKTHARSDAHQAVRDAGFDIEVSVRKLTELYMQLDREWKMK